MTYDFYGGWIPTPGMLRRCMRHPATRCRDEKPGKLNADAAVKAYVEGGVPAEIALVLGVPFYSAPGWAWKT